jgi:hypothetical protein
VPRDDSAYEQLRRNVLLSPERRLEQLLAAPTPTRVPFDPYAILAALERHRAAYVVIGAFGRIVQGADETTDGVDVAPSLRGDNPRRMALALDDLDAVRADGQPVTFEELSEEQPIELETSKGRLEIVPEPAGTRRGYDDLRRAATQQPIGRGLRITVASSADLARMLAALGRETDVARLLSLRRLQALEHISGHELEL